MNFLDPITDPQLDFGFWWPLVLVPFACWFAYRSYRASRPAPRPGILRLLLGLRCLSWVILLLLLARPVLRWIEREEQAAQLAVLLDRSASIPFLEGRTRHGDWLEELGRNLPGVTLRVFSFADSLEELRRDELDSLDCGGRASDPEAALAELERRTAAENLAGVLLVSDGNLTRGAWPVERARRGRARLWTAGTGRREAPRDLVLQLAECNREVRSAVEQPVYVEISSTGLTGRRAELILRADGRERDRREILLGAEGLRVPATLHWTPELPGTRVVELEARLIPGRGEPGESVETSLENNRRSLHVEVLERDRKVAVLAGSPSPDLAFLLRILEAEEGFELIRSFPDQDSGIPVSSAFAEAELLVLCGWPTSRSARSAKDELRSCLRRVSLLVLDLPGLDLAPLGGRLSLAGGAAAQLPPGIEAGVRARALHPVLGQEDRLALLQAVWSEMPPLRFLRPGLTVPPVCRVLLAADARPQSPPALCIEERGGLRAAYLGAEGIWRWELGSQLSLGENRRATECLGTLLRWLAGGRERKLFQVRPEEEVLPRGAPLVFHAELLDEDGSPRDGALVEVELLAENGTGRTILLSGRGAGRYRGRGAATETGTLRWSASAASGEREILADSGLVTVESYNPEFLDLRRNGDLLEQLAQAGGGSALDLDDHEDRAAIAGGRAFAALDARPLIREARRELELWGSGILLTALILLFSAEWLLRRLQGML